MLALCCCIGTFVFLASMLLLVSLGVMMHMQPLLLDMKSVATEADFCHHLVAEI